MERTIVTYSLKKLPIRKFLIQCVATTKRMTYKKLQADVFKKTVRKYKKLISLK